MDIKMEIDKICLYSIESCSSQAKFTAWLEMCTSVSPYSVMENRESQYKCTEKEDDKLFSQLVKLQALLKRTGNVQLEMHTNLLTRSLVISWAFWTTSVQ